jgi:hypothetical protein
MRKKPLQGRHKGRVFKGLLRLSLPAPDIWPKITSLDRKSPPEVLSRNSAFPAIPASHCKYTS